MKEFLSLKGFTFQEIDVSYDPEALEELRKLAHRLVVPATVINNEVKVDFDQKNFRGKAKVKLNVYHTLFGGKP
ncbi:MAG: glutaredoxin family protein [Deltaproteobacteria bacterium]|nr:glutaredoxin family protein [Deltaproteobacteria bacterium]